MSIDKDFLLQISASDSKNFLCLELFNFLHSQKIIFWPCRKQKSSRARKFSESGSEICNRQLLVYQHFLLPILPFLENLFLSSIKLKLKHNHTKQKKIIMEAKLLKNGCKQPFFINFVPQSILGSWQKFLVYVLFLTTWHKKVYKKFCFAPCISPTATLQPVLSFDVA